MSYTLRWKNPSLNANKAAEITVPVGSVVSNAASLRFTGKGAPGYGSIQQENLMRLLESFADRTPPQYPTVGQEWFDTAENTLRICISTTPVVWKSLGGIQVTAANAPAPVPAAVGDIWFQRTGPQTGIMYVYTGLGRYPETDTAIGGWNQVWPAVETIAGREEFDYVLSLVNQLVGLKAGGGNGALGKAIPAFRDLAALDASLRAKYAANVDERAFTPAGGSTAELMVDVNSNDWDMVLAAARYAINRLDLPASMLDDISPVPFVSDGRPAPDALTALAAGDVRYPSLERRSNRRFGIVTLLRSFTETVNVLTAAVANRYSLKGINGATGTNPNFAPTTEVSEHMTFSGSPGGATSEALSLRFQFTTADELQSFLASGGAIQVTMSHAGGNTAADTNLKNLLDSRGVMRLTSDKTRVFANVFPLALSIPPINTGLRSVTGATQTLTTQSLGGATVTVTSFVSTTSSNFVVTLSLVGGGALNGTTTIAFHVISDNTTYQTPAITRVYGVPLPFSAANKSGSAFLV